MAKESKKTKPNKTRSRTKITTKRKAVTAKSVITRPSRTLSGAPLAGALATEIARPLQTPALAVAGVRDRVVALVRSWAKMSSDPGMSDELETLWDAMDNGHPPSDFKQGGAQTLAQLVNGEFHTKFMPSDFYAAGTGLKTVGGLVKAVT